MSLVLIKYSAPWCGQCKNLAKEFKKNPVACEVQEVDVDEEDDEVLNNLKIKSIPVCILYKDDVEIKRWIGMVKSTEINEFIKTCLQ